MFNGVIFNKNCPGKNVLLFSKLVKSLNDVLSLLTS